MSYILDALRKSDQLRQRGAAPTLMLGLAATSAPKPRANLYYGLLALALLGAGIAIGWLRPWQPPPVAQAPAVIAAQAPAVAQARLPAPQPDSTAVPVPESNQPAQASVPARPSGDARVKPARQTAPPKPAAQAPKQAAAPAPAQDRSPKSEAAGAAAPAPVMAMADLPLAIQQELPLMSISVHAYSGKAGERLVGINNRLLHEGAEVAPGLKLEQITPDGMIFSYKGYNFRRGVR